MSWKIRHEGSPRTVDDLTPGQIAQGLEDGQWEPTDEVLGPDDTTWTAIENHKIFANVVEDLDLTPERKPEEGTHLDMTALIDVCLVLLVFFILTTGYAALQKMLEMGQLAFDKKNNVIIVPQKDVDKLMLQISVFKEGDKSVMRLEKEVINPAELPGRLSNLVRETKKVNLIVTHGSDVPWGDVVPIKDAAKFAGIQDKVFWSVPEDFLPDAPGR
jgi:biopolymer transport protein ExbD